MKYCLIMSLPFLISVEPLSCFQSQDTVLTHFHHSWNGKTEVIALMARNILWHSQSRQAWGRLWLLFCRKGPSLHWNGLFLVQANYHCRNNLESIYIFLFCLLKFFNFFFLRTDHKNIFFSLRSGTIFRVQGDSKYFVEMKAEDL